MQEIAQGFFIVFEGQGFGGKTTQAKILARKLKKLGLSVVLGREPGGIPQAEAIRDELLDRREKRTVTPTQEVELLYKSREIFLNKLVKPALKKGSWVISTRFSPSTFVYQGIEGGVSLDYIQKVDDTIVKGFQPDLYILLDLTEKEIEKRLTSNGREKHSFNELDKKKIKTRREGYLQIAKENKERNWVVVDGGQSVDEVSRKVWQIVSSKFNL